MDATSDEGFNSGGVTTSSNSPDMDRSGNKKQRRRKQRRNRNNGKHRTLHEKQLFEIFKFLEARGASASRTTSSKSSDEYLTRI